MLTNLIHGNDDQRRIVLELVRAKRSYIRKNPLPDGVDALVAAGQHGRDQSLIAEFFFLVIRGLKNSVCH